MPEHKYGRPKKRNIDQEAIGKFLNKLGFKTESISQEWRHLHAFGKYECKELEPLGKEILENRIL